MRIFIAIESSEHVKSKIFHESETLQKKNFFKGKFVDKKNLHFTLKFLGEISEEKLGDIEKKLKEIKFNRFECEVGKAGVFDSEKHIRTIWVGLISDKLKELEEKFEEHDEKIKAIFDVIHELMRKPEKPKHQIGFHN